MRAENPQLVICLATKPGTKLASKNLTQTEALRVAKEENARCGQQFLLVVNIPLIGGLVWWVGVVFICSIRSRFTPWRGNHD